MTFISPEARARSIPRCPFPDVEFQEQSVPRRSTTLFRDMEQKRIDADMAEFEKRSRIGREIRRRLKINNTLKLLGREEISLLAENKDYFRHPERHTRLLDLCCAVMGYKRREMTGPSRKRPLVVFRMIAMVIMKSETRLSFPGVGKIFNRDHSTVMTSKDKIEGDPELRQRAEDIAQKVLQLEHEKYGVFGNG